MRYHDAIPKEQVGMLSKRGLRSERGMTLLLVLVLSGIALVIMTTLLYLITTGTRLSGGEKRYRTAYEAALGGADIVGVVVRGQGAEALGSNITVNYPAGASAFDAVLLGGSFVAPSKTIDPTDPTTYDLSFDLGSAPNPVFRVYARFVSKSAGNTSQGYSGNVRTKTGVVPSSLGTQAGVAIPSYYSVSLLSQQTTNPNERVRMELVSVF